MTLHAPRNNNRDQKSFTHNWQENFYEIEVWLQKNYRALKDLVKESKRHAEKPYYEAPEPGEDSLLLGPPGRQGEIGRPAPMIFIEGYPGEDAPIVPGARGADGGGGSSYTDHDYEPLTNGDSATPEILFHDGDLVMHAVTWT